MKMTDRELLDLVLNDLIYQEGPGDWRLKRCSADCRGDLTFPDAEDAKRTIIAAARIAGRPILVFSPDFPERQVIWWTDPDEARAVVEGHDRARAGERDAPGACWLPSYLEEAIRSRRGVNARGRIWVDRWMGQVAKDEVAAVLRAAQTASNDVSAEVERRSLGGILAWRRDIDDLRGVPGFLTTARLERIRITERPRR